MISRTLRVPLVSVALALALGACGAAASPSTAPPDPTGGPPTATTATDTTTPPPTLAIPSGAQALYLTLETHDGSDVRVAVVDETGLLTGVTSGTPGDGMSVPVDAPTVADAAATSLVVTWSAPPCDSEPVLIVSDGRILIAQPECHGQTDAVAFDRVLILRFSDPIEADSMEVAIQEGIDTAG